MNGVIRTSELRELYEFTRWANGRILAVTGSLDAERLGRDLGSSFPSVRQTLAHIAQSDWIWLWRWRGESPAAPPEWDVGTHAAIRVHWEALMQERDVFLADLDDAAVRRVIAYRKLDGSAHANPLWQLLLHVVNHSTYHRGQITTMLRQLGAPTVATDLVQFYRERTEGGLDGDRTGHLSA